MKSLEISLEMKRSHAVNTYQKKDIGRTNDSEYALVNGIAFYKCK